MLSPQTLVLETIFMEKNVFPSAFHIAEFLPIQISLVVRRLRPIPIQGDQKFMHWGLRVAIPVKSLEYEREAKNPPPIETRVEYQEFVCQLESRNQFIIEPNIDTFRAEDWENSFSLGEENIPPAGGMLGKVCMYVCMKVCRYVCMLGKVCMYVCM